MSLTLILLASAAAKAAPPAPPPDFEWAPMYLVAPPSLVPRGTQMRPVIVITPSNVELTGAGDLVVKPDLAPLEEMIAPSNFGRAIVQVMLWFDRTGTLLSCDGTGSWNHDKTARICGAIGSTAQFRFAPGFAQPLERGYLHVWFDIQAHVEPRQPLRFRPRDKGQKITMRVDSTGKCRVLLAKFSDPASAQLCEAVSANPHALKARKAINSSSDTHTVKFWIDAMPLPVDQRITVNIEPIADRISETIHYPERSESEPFMPISAGSFTLSLTAQDRPQTTLRITAIRPTKVLVGIDSAGRLQTCRPLESSGTSHLDNHACVLAMAKGVFSPAGTPAVPGLRHVLHTIDWAVIKDASATR